MHITSFNHKYRTIGANRVPVAAGDRYWSQDLARDHRYLQGLAARALLDLFGTDSALLSGGLVTEGSTKGKVNVSEAVGICSFDVEVPDDSSPWAVPAPSKVEQIKVRVACPAVVDLALGGTLDGVTPNYIKLRFLEADGSNARNREYASGSYACSKAESYQLIADAIAPTEYDVFLATYVGDGISTLTITQQYPKVGSRVEGGNIIKTDANGRAKVAEPSMASDIATANSLWSVGINHDSSSILDANSAPIGSISHIEDTEANCVTKHCPTVGGTGNRHWNIVTIGQANRVTQIAQQAYIGQDDNTYGALFQRSKHDTTWSSWIRVDNNAQALFASLQPEIINVPYTITERSLPDSNVQKEYNVIALSPVTIKQNNAEHVISYKDLFFTTKGVNGSVSLKYGDRAKLTYRGSIPIKTSPVKIPNPAVLPAGTGYDAAWSPDGRYLAIAHDITPFITIYDWSSGSPIKIADPAVLPVGKGQGVAWSPNGRYLAITHSTTPFITIYDWISGSPVKLPNPAVLPPGWAVAVAWSLDGRYLAVGHSLGSYLTIYDWISGSPIKIPDPSIMPPGDIGGFAWSPSGRYLALGCSNNTFIIIYDWYSGSPVKLPNPAVLPSTVVTGVAWSPDERYLVLSLMASPFIMIYDWINGSPVKLPDLISLPTSRAESVKFSADGRYLVIVFGTAPFIIIYDWFSGSPVKIPNPAVLPAGTGYDAAWSPDGRYLAIAHGITPFITIYDWISTTALEGWDLDIETSTLISLPSGVIKQRLK